MGENSQIWDQISEQKSLGEDFIVITVTHCRGSVPSVLGAKAIVATGGLVHGTLGGGKVEARAIETAQEMLSGESECQSLTWNLQRDIGMTCGGEVSFLYEKVICKPRWHIVVFGAGHVTKALVPVLAGMDCRIDVIDEREDWLDAIPSSVSITKTLVDYYTQGVELVNTMSMVVCLTKGHATDRPVLLDCFLRFPDLPFIGVIGSKAKRAVLLGELREDGVPESQLAKLVCPLGLAIGGNAAGEIAISIAAQLLSVRDEV